MKLSTAAMIAALTAFPAGLSAMPVVTKERVFVTTLTAAEAPTIKDSKATGEARLVLNTETKTVDITLDVTGLTTDNLWDRLVAAPVGPIHFHAYGHDHSDPNSASLALPVPYGPTYTATAKGFRVVVKGYPYAEGAALVKSATSFDDFVASLEHGSIVMNIHTDRATDGEISGTMKPAT